MALNNLERLVAQGERPAFFRLLGGHPGALQLVARLGGTSQFLADTLRRRPTLFSWLLEPGTLRQWLARQLAARVCQSASPLHPPPGRWNAPPPLKYRQLLRIGRRDILGDADLTVTTEELSNLADVCLAAAWLWAEEDLHRRYGEPRAEDGTPTGFAVIGMGKLGGSELNYSSDIDLVFVYGDDGETSGGEEGKIPNGDYFAAGARTPVQSPEVGDRRGVRVPRGPAPPPRGAHGRGRPLAPGLSRLSRGAGGAVGASGAHQGAILRRRSRGGGALLRAGAPFRLPFRGRPGHRGG